MKTLVLILTLGGMLAFAVGLAFYVWSAIGEAQISTNGMIALGLGVVATTALGVGLMWLVFYSSRKGYDDDHH